MIYHSACLVCSHSTNSYKPIKSCYNCANHNPSKFMTDSMMLIEVSDDEEVK